MNETRQSQYCSITHCVAAIFRPIKTLAHPLRKSKNSEPRSIYLVNVSLKWSVSIFESSAALIRRYRTILAVY